MSLLEITLERRHGESWPVTLEETRQGSFLARRRESWLELDPASLNRPLTVAEYGQVLGEAVFHGPLRDALAATRAGAEEVRVLLVVEAEELQCYHWQRLMAPSASGWDFLALDRRTPLSLYLPSSSGHRFPPIGRCDLGALVVVAEPAGLEDWGLEPFGAVATAEAVREALGDVRCDVLGSVPGALGPASLDGVCARLITGQYSLLHVVAHGRYDRRSGETVVFLEKDLGQADRSDPVDRVHDVAASELLRRLERLGRGLPHLAFLATCESANPEAEQALGGLAQRMVRELGLPAVVAMTEKVSLPTARALATGFYRRLGEHGHADRALTEATLDLADHADILVPALFTRLADQPLWSDAVDRQLTEREIEAGLSILEGLVAERAPVLESEYLRLAESLRRGLGADAGQLEVEQLAPEVRAERDAALLEIGNLCEEVVELSFHALALGQTPPAYDGRCPFEPEELRGLLLQDPLPRGLRRTLEQRASTVGLRFEAGLVSLLLDDVRDQPGGPGLLARTLPGLWLCRHGRWLRVAEYEALGGVLGVATAAAEAAWNDLAELEQPWTEHILGRLVRPDAGGYELGEGPPSPRRATLAELIPASQPAAPILDLVQRLAAAGLLAVRRAARDETAGGPADPKASLDEAILDETPLDETPLDEAALEETAVALAHGGLIGAWPRLERLIVRRQEALLAVDDVRRATRAWQGAAAAREDLLAHRGARLEEIESRARRGDVLLCAAEQHYLDACVEHRDAEALAELERVRERGEAAAARARIEAAAAERLRRRAWVISGLASIAVGLAVLALFMARSERRERQISLARQLAAQSLSLADVELDLAALLAVESDSILEDLGLRHAAESRRSLLHAVTHNPRLDRYFAPSQDPAARPVGMIDLALEPGGKRVAVAGEDGSILIFDVATLELLARSPAQAPDGTSGWIRQLAWPPAGEHPGSGEESSGRMGSGRLVSISSEGEAIIWRLAEDLEGTLEMVAEARTGGAEDRLRAVAWSPDGGELATVSSDGWLGLWQPDSLHPEPATKPISQPSPSQRTALRRISEEVLSTVAWSPDGRTIAAGGRDPAVYLWQVDDAAPGPTVPLPSDRVAELVFRPDGRQLAVASVGLEIVFIEPQTGSLQGSPAMGHNNSVTSLAYSPDGKRLASGGADSRIVLWEVVDAADGAVKPIGQLTGHTGRVLGLGFTPATSDGVLGLLSSSQTGELIGWRPFEGRSTLARPVHGAGSGSLAVALAPGGGMLATADQSGAVAVWDTEGEQRKALAPAHAGPAMAVDWHPEGTALAAVGGDGRCLIWDIPSGKLRRRSAASESLERTGLVSLDWSPDGRRLATGGEDGRVRIWDPDLGEPVAALEGHVDSVMDLAWRPSSGAPAAPGSVVLASVSSDSALLWLAPDLSEPREIYLNGFDFLSVAWAPDGSTLITGGLDNVVRLWNPATGEAIGGPLSGARNMIFDLAVSPDGSSLYALSYNEGVLLFDLETKRFLGPISGAESLTGLAMNLALSEKGDRLVTGSYLLSSSARLLPQAVVWDIDPSQWRQRACDRAHRPLSREEWSRYLGPGLPYDPACSRGPG